MCPAKRMDHEQTRHPDVITQHAIGAFVGSAVGDALGAPFEFDAPGLYSRRHPSSRLTGTGEMTGGGGFGWKPGEFTDDTDMAVALGESLAAHRQLVPADLWKRWRAWATAAKDIGILTRLALESSLHDGAAEIAERRNHGHSAGNGSLMRNTPVPLSMLHASDDERWSLAVAQSALTHRDPDAGVGCGIHSLMVCDAVLGRNPFDGIDRSLDRLTGETRQRWLDLLSRDWQPDRAEHPNGTVWTCLAQAVWAVRGASSFREALIRAIDLGGDTDTVACVTGSIAGAIWGIQAIPSRWTTYLHGTVQTQDGPRAYRNVDMQDLARRLLLLPPVKAAYQDEPAGPTQVCDDVPLHAADWAGARTAPATWAIVSACRTNADFHKHPLRREVFLIDQYDESSNHDAVSALEDAVDAIDAFLAEDPSRAVVVHCHGGRSRTGLILKAWAMRRHGFDEERAHAWLVERWPRAHRDNPVFVRVLREEWPRRIRARRTGGG